MFSHFSGFVKSQEPCWRQLWKECIASDNRVWIFALASFVSQLEKFVIYVALMFDPKLTSLGIPLFLAKSVDTLHQKQSKPGIRQLLHPLHFAPALWPLYPGRIFTQCAFFQVHYRFLNFDTLTITYYTRWCWHIFDCKLDLICCSCFLEQLNMSTGLFWNGSEQCWSYWTSKNQRYQLLSWPVSHCW